MKADLKKPCNQCPFARKAAKGWLGEKRARQIGQVLVDDDLTIFTCHKTDRPHRFAESEITDDTQHCGGAMLFLINCNAQNVFMRMRMAFGNLRMSDFTKANRKKVFASVAEFIKHHSWSE